MHILILHGIGGHAGHLNSDSGFSTFPRLLEIVENLSVK